MNNLEYNNMLILTPAHKIKEWKGIVESEIKKGNDIIVFFDTETTGGVRPGNRGASAIEKDDMKYYNKRHRVIEIGARVCIKDKHNNIVNLRDSEGTALYFHEYINPWRENEVSIQKLNTIHEVPWGAYQVHGISKEFLFGNDYLGSKIKDDSNAIYHQKQFKLEKVAPTFEEIIDDFMDVTGLNCDVDFNLGQKNPIFVAHNNEFDNKMMHNEFLCMGKNGFESYIRPLCTLILSRELLPKSYISGKGLSNLYESLKNYGLITKEIDRTLHGALVDVDILQLVFEGITKTDFYKNAKNTPTYELLKPKNTESELIKKFLTEKQQTLPLLSDKFRKKFIKN